MALNRTKDSEVLFVGASPTPAFGSSRASCGGVPARRPARGARPYAGDRTLVLTHPFVELQPLTLMPRLTLLLALLFTITLTACGGGESEPIEGPEPVAATNPDLPIQGVMDLGPIDAALAAEGEADFTTRCTTCHKMDERYVGPALGDVLTRRSPEWVMNMILAPDKMIVSDPDAQALLAEYSVPMTNQNLTQDEARAILEYLRQTAEGS